ncbi:glycosyltransferase family 2 protein [Candidatus Chloroploca sp. M-50]|uniref:Glycosyltransferase family 2 protein n=1 Tax=Candidatus Chloroploca mongolica TaxID=2528176 RepID=A0ABS4D462_9CHLR|nr:glycosyltransferase family 2 protein [Candidatus Chloroploca mongolica]
MNIVSVLIITHNSAHEIGPCLDTLAQHTRVPYEIIVVDNASADDTMDAIRRSGSLRLVTNTTNVGFAAAVNQATRLAGGRYLLLLNPDTQVYEGAIDRLVAFLDSHPSVGICAPRVLAVDGCLRHNCFAFETPWSFFWFGVGVGPLHRVRRWMLRRTNWNIAADTPQTVEAVTGAVMLVRRELFEQLGGLDERFFMYCEDGDFCYRAHQQGWKTMLVPDAVITHVRGASTPPDTPLLNGMIGTHLLRSRYCYTQKYWGRSAAWLLRWAYATVGLLFWLSGHVPLFGVTGDNLKTLGRLLWATPIPHPMHPDWKG